LLYVEEGGPTRFMVVLRRNWKLFVALVPLLWFAYKRLDGEWKSRQQSPRLLTAAQVGDRISVLSSLEEGATADARDSHQCTALMLAAAHGDINIARSLLDSGATVNIRDRHGWTALMWATAAGSPDLVALFIFWKADVNARSGDGMTALKLAHALASGTKLVDAGTRPLLPEQLRKSALIVQMLEQAGARE
jgi:hypothetical protein